MCAFLQRVVIVPCVRWISDRADGALHGGSCALSIRSVSFYSRVLYCVVDYAQVKKFMTTGVFRLASGLTRHLLLGRWIA